MYVLRILSLPLLPCAWQADLHLLQYLDSLTLWFLAGRYGRRLRVSGKTGQGVYPPLPVSSLWLSSHLWPLIPDCSSLLPRQVSAF